MSVKTLTTIFTAISNTSGVAVLDNDHVAILHEVCGAVTESGTFVFDESWIAGWFEAKHDKGLTDGELAVRVIAQVALPGYAESPERDELMATLAQPLLDFLSPSATAARAEAARLEANARKRAEAEAEVCQRAYPTSLLDVFTKAVTAAMAGMARGVSFDASSAEAFNSLCSTEGCNFAYWDARVRMAKDDGAAGLAKELYKGSAIKAECDEATRFEKGNEYLYIDKMIGFLGVITNHFSSVVVDNRNEAEVLADTVRREAAKAAGFSPVTQEIVYKALNQSIERLVDPKNTFGFKPAAGAVAASFGSKSFNSLDFLYQAIDMGIDGSLAKPGASDELASSLWGAAAMLSKCVSTAMGTLVWELIRRDARSAFSADLPTHMTDLEVRGWFGQMPNGVAEAIMASAAAAQAGWSEEGAFAAATRTPRRITMSFTSTKSEMTSRDLDDDQFASYSFDQIRAAADYMEVDMGPSLVETMRDAGELSGKVRPGADAGFIEFVCKHVGGFDLLSRIKQAEGLGINVYNDSQFEFLVHMSDSSLNGLRTVHPVAAETAERGLFTLDNPAMAEVEQWLQLRTVDTTLAFTRENSALNRAIREKRAMIAAQAAATKRLAEVKAGLSKSGVVLGTVKMPVVAAEKKLSFREKMEQAKQAAHVVTAEDRSFHSTSAFEAEDALASAATDDDLESFIASMND